jgi:hypothetical protein
VSSYYYMPVFALILLYVGTAISILQ